MTLVYMFASTLFLRLATRKYLFCLLLLYIY